MATRFDLTLLMQYNDLNLFFAKTAGLKSGSGAMNQVHVFLSIHHSLFNSSFVVVPRQSGYKYYGFTHSDRRPRWKRLRNWRMSQRWL